MFAVNDNGNLRRDESASIGPITLVSVAATGTDEGEVNRLVTEASMGVRLLVRVCYRRDGVGIRRDAGIGGDEEVPMVLLAVTCCSVQGDG